MLHNIYACSEEEWKYYLTILPLFYGPYACKWKFPSPSPKGNFPPLAAMARKGEAVHFYALVKNDKG